MFFFFFGEIAEIRRDFYEAGEIYENQGGTFDRWRRLIEWKLLVFYATCLSNCPSNATDISVYVYYPGVRTYIRVVLFFFFPFSFFDYHRKKRTRKKGEKNEIK